MSRTTSPTCAGCRCAWGFFSCSRGAAEAGESLLWELLLLLPAALPLLCFASLPDPGLHSSLPEGSSSSAFFLPCFPERVDGGRREDRHAPAVLKHKAQIPPTLACPQAKRDEALPSARQRQEDKSVPFFLAFFAALRSCWLFSSSSSSRSRACMLRSACSLLTLGAPLPLPPPEPAPPYILGIAGNGSGMREKGWRGGGREREERERERETDTDTDKRMRALLRLWKTRKGYGWLPRATGERKQEVAKKLEEMRDQRLTDMSLSR